MGVLALLVFSYITVNEHSGAGLERDLIQKNVEAEYHVMSFGTFLRWSPYDHIGHLAYLRVVSRCNGGDNESYLKRKFILLIKWKN